LREAGILDVDKASGQVSGSERALIAKQLLDWPLRVTGTNPWSAAQTTAGGVDVREIDPKTMESKLTPGLYFAGEIIDIDGDCGGYNLQWAWSSGFVAGESAGLATRTHSANRLRCF
jgi:predicted Rossmann fold flavoprotein